jgi:hypothetical protein
VEYWTCFSVVEEKQTCWLGHHGHLSGRVAFLDADRWGTSGQLDAEIYEGHRRRNLTAVLMQSAATSGSVGQSLSDLDGPTMSGPAPGNQVGGSWTLLPSRASGRCCTAESARGGTGAGNERVGAE